MATVDGDDELRAALMAVAAVSLGTVRATGSGALAAAAAEQVWALAARNSCLPLPHRAADASVGHGVMRVNLEEFDTGTELAEGGLDEDIREMDADVDGYMTGDELQLAGEAAWLAARSLDMGNFRDEADSHGACGPDGKALLEAPQLLHGLDAGSLDGEAPHEVPQPQHGLKVGGLNVGGLDGKALHEAPQQLGHNLASDGLDGEALDEAPQQLVKGLNADGLDGKALLEMPRQLVCSFDAGGLGGEALHEVPQQLAHPVEPGSDTEIPDSGAELGHISQDFGVLSQPAYSDADTSHGAFNFRSILVDETNLYGVACFLELSSWSALSATARATIVVRRIRPAAHGVSCGEPSGLQVADAVAKKSRRRGLMPQISNASDCSAVSTAASERDVVLAGIARVSSLDATAFELPRPPECAGQESVCDSYVDGFIDAGGGHGSKGQSTAYSNESEVDHPLGLVDLKTFSEFAARVASFLASNRNGRTESRFRAARRMIKDEGYSLQEGFVLAVAASHLPWVRRMASEAGFDLSAALTTA